MNRTNYLLSWSERRIGIALPSAISPSLRVPLAVLSCAVVLVAVLWCVQYARFAAAQREGEQYGRRLAALGRELARARAIEADLAAAHGLVERLRTLRRSGPLQASEIARLGNRLPENAWLTSLRSDQTGFELQGHSARIDAVGAALAGLATLAPYRGARLISARDEPGRGGVSYAIALERSR